MIVTRSRWIRPSSAAGSRTTGFGARTTAAPDTSGTYSSRAAMSNAIVVTAASRSPPDSTNRSAIDSTKFVSADRGTTTPLGRPVDPDVYSTNVGCAGATGISGLSAERLEDSAKSDPSRMVSAGSASRSTYSMRPAG
ncbi:hypothetical protein Lesp02_17100 [Lentzea sp. NBRC 105346]|nr:hypothetical protein Lesp02_17100 [Lentzea sp. NBRC 105346]